MIYRDYTYWGYKQEPIREAPDSDNYPYYGEKAIEMATEMLVNASLFSSGDEAISYINSILDLSESIGQSREYITHPRIDTTMMDMYSKNIPPDSLKAITRAWLSTLHLCYDLKN